MGSEESVIKIKRTMKYMHFTKKYYDIYKLTYVKKALIFKFHQLNVNNS